MKYYVKPLLLIMSYCLCTALLGCVLLIRYQSFSICFVHNVLLATILRIVYLVAKPIIVSLAGLVFLGLLPSALTLSSFLHVLLAWASLQLFALTASPFAKLRIPFVIIVRLLFLIIFAIAVAVSANENREEIDIVIAGSYALYALACLLIWSVAKFD